MEDKWVSQSLLIIRDIYHRQTMTNTVCNANVISIIRLGVFPKPSDHPWHPRPGESHPPRRDKTCGVNHAIPHLHTSRFKVTLSIPHETTLTLRCYFRPSTQLKPVYYS